MGEFGPYDVVPLHGEEWLYAQLQERVEAARGRAWEAADWDGEPGRCEICGWEMMLGDDPERSSGYTDGAGWICGECFVRLVR